MKNLDKYVNDNYKLSLDEGFGTWIHNGVWYGDESLTFEEAKEVFFLTLKKLLDDEQVILSPPTKLHTPPVKFLDPYPKSHIKHGQYKWDVWDIPNEEIIQYMRDTFPKNVSDENDDKVCDFWFSEDCPQIAWIDQETGEIFGS
jgi:hypothetical protein